MPTLQGLLRLHSDGSESDSNRRHSFIAMGPASIGRAEGRASEQLPRRPDLSNLEEPLTTSTPARVVSSATPEPSLKSPSEQEDTAKRHRFSMLKFRHASDSQLATRARLQAQAQAHGIASPPLPDPPAIITTAPTMDIDPGQTKKESKIRLTGRSKPSSVEPEVLTEKDGPSPDEESKTVSGNSDPSGRVTFEDADKHASHAGASAPPAYGDEGSSTLAIPVNRLSESSRSDASSGDHGVYATTTTTTHTIHTTTTFFKLPRRKKPGPLFPLPPKVIPPDHGSSLAVPSPFGKGSTSSRNASIDSAPVRSSRRPFWSVDGEASGVLPSPTHSAAATSSMTVPGHGIPLIRHGSNASSLSSPTRSRIGMRGRSSTLSSLRNMPSDDPLPTPTMASTRTSTSTGRKSFGDLFGLSHKIRQNSETNFSRSGHVTPGSNTSKDNSMQLPRDTYIIPERQQEDTPARYLVRLEEAVSRGVVASVLSKSADQFSQQVLRSYMRGFSFFGDPIDMSIRKLLMEAELPKETQQIDRCLEAFANRYHECNPGIYATPEQAYFIAFSLIILHTDVFNKNNKHKMQKPDYVKNTRGEGIFDDILECFYDNITYTPFIHVEDDIDINGERIVQHKSKKKSRFTRSNIDVAKKPLKEPIDPYTLLIDNNLEILRPNLKEVMHLDEHYNYLGTAKSLNMQDLQKTFFKTGVLQIISARSRPDAFMSESTVTNPQEAHVGIVDIKITKVGLLWRKDSKKKKTRSPWQEWGAILTGAQLYFFRDVAWIKNLIHQHATHVKQGHDGVPIIFKPPLDSFKPDALMSTDDAVALLDSTYKRHKNAFVFVRHGGFEETFLADNEDEMNDWITKLNYAAAFRTAGVRMRGLVGGHYEGQRTRGIRRLGSSSGSTRSVSTPTGDVTITSGRIDTKMAQDIMTARREIMLQRFSEADEKLAVAQRQLDLQLRNARHLLILAPIQSKTREQVVHAAGKMSAQLKWTRMEIWRLKCHKHILEMDLEEEKPRALHSVADSETAAPLKATDKASLIRLNSSESTNLAPQRSPQTPESRSSTQPTLSKDDFRMDGLPGSPLEHKPFNYHKAQAAWELPPLKFDSAFKHGPSNSISKTLSHISSFPDLRPAPTVETQRAVSNPQPDAVEQAVLEQAGLVESNPRPDQTHAGTSAEATKEASEKDRIDRGKIRRSLHRTLRDAHVPTHARSRKGKDSSSTAGVSEEGNTEDVLSRGTGSFVVHGKKASVITFGDELSHLSTDDRLRMRKQAQKEETGGVEEETQRALQKAFQSQAHRDSAASASTATARSFSELHKRLSQHAATLTSTSDGDDSEAAISFSDGRRTPLPHVDDGDNDKEISGDGDYGQRAFYSPEPPESPEKKGLDERGGEGVEMESSPLAQSTAA